MVVPSRVYASKRVLSGALSRADLRILAMSPAPSRGIDFIDGGAGG
jgi:hypothetical protein